MKFDSLLTNATNPHLLLIATIKVMSKPNKWFTHTHNRWKLLMPYRVQLTSTLCMDATCSMEPYPSTQPQNSMHLLGRPVLCSGPNGFVRGLPRFFDAISEEWKRQENECKKKKKNSFECGRQQRNVKGVSLK